MLTVPAKARRYVQIVVVRMRTHNTILIERIELVVSGPGVFHLNRLEGRHHLRQIGPHRLVEKRMINVPQIVKKAGTLVVAGRFRKHRLVHQLVRLIVQRVVQIVAQQTVDQ